MTLSRGSKGFLVVLVAMVLVVAGALTFLRAAPAPAGTGPVEIEVPEGAGASQVATILEERGVIGSAFAFRIGSRLDGRSGQIQPGSYQLTPGMNTTEILDVLTAPRPLSPSYTVTIPEGLNVAQTLQRLADAEGSPFTFEQLVAALPSVARPGWVPAPETLPAEQPYPGLTPYEGLLFPDTYEFFVEEDAVAVLTELVRTTDQVLGQVSAPAGLDLYGVLKVASLIEREARLPEEQATISSVIHNRLAIDMKLDIDATVLYATASVGSTSVTREQVQQPSPWNTYSVNTLPPTPISGAGLGAITAAAVPADTPFLYYVVSDPSTGAHAFAETFEEHSANVARYRALQSG